MLAGWSFEDICYVLGVVSVALRIFRIVSFLVSSGLLFFGFF